MQPPDTEPCQHLPWDTAFFGRPTARVRADTLTPARAAEIDRWCREHDIALLYFLARGDDATTARAAHDANFRLVDVRMTFERGVTADNTAWGGHSGPPGPVGAAPPASRQGGADILVCHGRVSGGIPAPRTRPNDAPPDPSGEPTAAAPPHVTPYAPADLPALRSISRASFTDSRFYHDERIPRETCDQLYDEWITTTCRDDAERVLVARAGDRAIGYVTLSVDRPARTGQIDLLAVDAASRGKRVGTILVDAAVAWAAAQDLKQITVVTQARNVPAQRLYQRAGFLTRSVQLYFHKWYD